MIHLEVAVAAPLEQTLTYSLLESTDQEAEIDQRKKYVGRRVLVWLGKRKVTGYVLDVVKISGETPYKIRTISKFLDDIPLFHENSVPFYRWVANYYHYPLGMVIKTALPGGLAPKSLKKLVLQINPIDFPNFFEAEIPPWALKLSTHGELGAADTTEILSERKTKKLVDDLIEIDAVSIANVVAKDGVQEKSEICYGFTARICLPLQKLMQAWRGRRKYQQKVSRETGIDLKLSEVKALYSLQHLTEKINRETIALKDLRHDYSGASKALIALEEKAFCSFQREGLSESLW